MFSNSLARFTAALPSSLKYPLSSWKPLYARFLRFGQPVIKITTVAGELRWHVDELTSQRIILGTYESYMQKAFLEFVSRGLTVYDVGAHAGYHTALCSLLVGNSGKVFAFEPHPQNVTSLQKQLDINEFSNVTVCSFALSNRSGPYRLDTGNGDSQGFLSEVGDLKVVLRSIDQLVSQEHYPPPNVIKIDVEGHERQVLEGALETLSRHKPVILCDHNDDRTFPELRELLEPAGYVLRPGPPIIAKHIEMA